jgi:membrane-associated phospholipid phosphatase
MSSPRLPGVTTFRQDLGVLASCPPFANEPTGFCLRRGGAVAGAQVAWRASVLRLDSRVRVTALAVAFGAFTLLSVLVEGRGAVAGDRVLSDALQGDQLPGGSSPVVRSVMSAWTYLGGGIGMPLLASIAVVVVASRSGWARNLAFLVIAVQGAGAMGRVLKGAFERPRPSLSSVTLSSGLRPVVLLLVLAVVLIAWRSVPRQILLLGAVLAAWVATNETFKAAVAIRSEHDAFPSGHAVASMALASAVLLLTWGTRWRIPALIGGALFVLSVGGSRLYFGFHHPSDVLAGWCLALAWVFAVDLVLDLRVTSALMTRTSARSR